MSDQSEDHNLQLWELHFHRTMTVAEGTQDIDVFTLRLRDPKLPFLTFTVPHSREGMELVHLVCARMNQDDRTVLLNPEKLEELNAAFHGPWHHSEMIGRHIILTDAEVLKIRRFIYRENAARLSIEGQYRFLFADHHRLMKAYTIVEQELLRLHAIVGAKEAGTRAEDEDHDDLLLADGGKEQLEIDMAGKKPVLCRADPPTKGRDVA